MDGSPRNNFASPISLYATRVSARFPVCLLAVLFLSLPLFAENTPAKPAATRPALAPKAADPAINMNLILSRSYEARTREVLERYLPPKEFEVIVDVTPNNKVLPNAPYEPRAQTPGAPLNMPIEELDQYVAKLRVQVLLSNRVASSQRRVEELLNRAIATNKKRGDIVSFSPLGIDLEDETWHKEKGDLKQEIEILRSVNDRVARELADAKATLDQNQKKQDIIVKNTNNNSTTNKTDNHIKNDIEQGKGGGENANTPQDNPFMKYPWYIPSIVGGAAFLLLLGLMLLGLGLRSAGLNLGGGLASIADSMSAIGGAIGSIAPATSGGGIQSLEAKMITEGGSKSGGLASLRIDTLHSHLLKMRNEILENMSDQTEGIILRYLTTLLANTATVSRAVIVLELLGRDAATVLFSRLGVIALDNIMMFLRTGFYDRSKVEMMLEAAEELKTKLLMETLDKTQGSPSEKVASQILQISDEELVTVALELDAEYIPRLFLYLEPRRIAGLLGSLRRLNAGKYQETVGTLVKMPEVTVAKQYDDNIAVALENVIHETKSDPQRPFLKIYQDIVEASDEDVSEMIVRELSSDPKINTYFKENVIGIHTLFLITTDQRAELIDALSNKDLAGLATGIKDEERQKIFDALTPRRRAMVTEEYESLTSRGGRQASYVFKRVRDSLVKRLKELKLEGQLMVATSSDNTEATKRAA